MGRARRAVASLAVACALALARTIGAQSAPVRIDSGRFTVVCYPGDSTLGRSLVAGAIASDTFPGLPRPRGHVLVAIAPDAATFRQWGEGAPEWGAALAFPASRRIVLQGHTAGSDAGDPQATLRHELAHLALHEFLGDLPPRWFDEGYAGYAAGEWRRESALTTNLALALRGMPTLDELEDRFAHGSTTAEEAYALSYQAVLDLAQLDPEHGLARLFPLWRETGSLDKALRRGYGMTLDQFEDDWRRQTRHRYGALAVVGDVTLAGLLVLLLVVPLYVARRRRDRARLVALREADARTEAAERAEQASMLAALLGEPLQGDGLGEGSGERGGGERGPGQTPDDGV